jgi:CRP/FNR family transcriptional regulator, cyclic AMP receptor protein
VHWGLLADVKTPILEQVSATSTVRAFRSGEVVFHQGDRAAALYIVQTGRFEVEVSTPDGESMQLRIHGSGEHFGELPILDARLTRTATVRAIEPSSALVVNAEAFASLRERDPSIDRFLVKSLTDLVVQLTQESTDNAYLSTDRRLAKRLLSLAEIYGSGTAENAPVAIPVTQEHLAMATGATRPTINRMLGELESKGIIQRSRNRIVVLNRRGLLGLTH